MSKIDSLLQSTSFCAVAWLKWDTFPNIKYIKRMLWSLFSGEQLESYILTWILVKSSQHRSIANKSIKYYNVYAPPPLVNQKKDQFSVTLPSQSHKSLQKGIELWNSFMQLTFQPAAMFLIILTIFCNRAKRWQLWRIHWFQDTRIPCYWDRLVYCW